MALLSSPAPWKQSAKSSILTVLSWGGLSKVERSMRLGANKVKFVARSAERLRVLTDLSGEKLTKLEERHLGMKPLNPEEILRSGQKDITGILV